MTAATANHTHLAVRLLSELSGDEPGEWRFARGETIRIGRSSDNEIQLRHEKMSRRHATVSFQGEEWVCNSLGRNGTFHQARLVTDITIHDGIVLELVKSGPRLHFQLVGDGSFNLDAEDDPSDLAWIGDFGDAAANDLCDDYFQRVVMLARTQLAARHRRYADEEDIAVSVLESLCAGMLEGRFPDVKSRDSLWRLLCVMTRRKVARHVNRERRQKRGGGLVRGESVFVGNVAADSQGYGLEQVEGNDDAISFGVQLAEETEWLFEILGDEELCRIAELKLAECTVEEIAEQLGCHARTVKRRLQIIRSILASAMTDEE